MITTILLLIILPILLHSEPIIEVDNSLIERVYTNSSYKIKIPRGKSLDISLKGKGEYTLLKDGVSVSLPYTPQNEEILDLDLKLTSEILLKITLKPILAFPVSGESFDSIGGTFGVSRGKRFHEGLDIFANKNTAVLSVADDLLVTNDLDNPLGGITLVLYDNKNHLYYYYTHLTLKLVCVGDIVNKNQPIGTVGNTGNATTTPPHLHFGIYDKLWTKPIDPLPFIYQENVKEEFVFPDSLIEKNIKQGNKIISQGRDYIRILNKDNVILKITL